MKKVHISELKVGDMVAKIDSNWFDTPFLRHRFKVSGEDIIKKLEKSGIDYVFIEENECNPISEIVTEYKEELINVQNEKLPEYYIDLDKFSSAVEIYEQSVKIIKCVMEDIRSGKLFDKSGIKLVADKIAQLTVKNKGMLTSIAKLKKYDEYTFQHSMNVSVFATSLGRAIGLQASDVNLLSSSGLLHDTGKMLVPNNILNKPGKLTDDEFSIMKNHVILGYDYLKEKGFSEESLKIVLEHHERYDGSGYPYGLKDEQISIYGKIGAVVDIYDAITSDRIYHKGMEPPSALKLMFKWSDSHINKKVFELFVANIGIYPVGTAVLLNTNELAIVAKVDKNPVSPVVIVFKTPRGSGITSPFAVDLDKKSIVQRKIMGPVNPEQIDIPNEVYYHIEKLNDK